MDKTISIVQLSDGKIAEVVSPKVERFTEQQLLEIKADLQKKMDFVDSVLQQFKADIQ